MTVVVVPIVVVALVATKVLEKEEEVSVKLQIRGKNILVPSVLQNTHTKIEPSALGLVYVRSF